MDSALEGTRRSLGRIAGWADVVETIGHLASRVQLTPGEACGRWHRQTGTETIIFLSASRSRAVAHVGLADLDGLGASVVQGPIGTRPAILGRRLIGVDRGIRASHASHASHAPRASHASRASRAPGSLGTIAPGNRHHRIPASHHDHHHYHHTVILFHIEPPNGKRPGPVIGPEPG